MVTRIEALADGLTRVTGWNDPESDAYQNRNPGDLQAISPRHPRDRRGKRIFANSILGFRALLYDLKVKCGGFSRSGLKSTSKLFELTRVYGLPDVSAEIVASWVRRALKDETVNKNTEIGWFVE